MTVKLWVLIGSIYVLIIILNPIQRALSHTAQGAAQVFLLVSARRSSHFAVLHRVV